MGIGPAGLAVCAGIVGAHAWAQHRASVAAERGWALLGRPLVDFDGARFLTLHQCRVSVTGKWLGGTRICVAPPDAKPLVFSSTSAMVVPALSTESIETPYGSLHGPAQDVLALCQTAKELDLGHLFRDAEMEVDAFGAKLSFAARAFSPSKAGRFVSLVDRAAELVRRMSQPVAHRRLICENVSDNSSPEVQRKSLTLLWRLYPESPETRRAFESAIAAHAESVRKAAVLLAPLGLELALAEVENAGRSDPFRARILCTVNDLLKSGELDPELVRSAKTPLNGVLRGRHLAGPMLMWEVVRYLEHIQPPNAQERLIELVFHPDFRVQVQALAAIERLGVPEGFELTRRVAERSSLPGLASHAKRLLMRRTEHERHGALSLTESGLTLTESEPGALSEVDPRPDRESPGT